MDIDIASLIPHRPPFLLIDRILELDADAVVAETTLRPDVGLWPSVYAGHYPGNPVTPGVLLCEMVFQAAAVYMAKRLEGAGASGTPVVTRIQNAKFKTMALPGDVLEIRAQFVEQMASAFFMKGGIKSGGKTVLQIEFAVALV